MSKSIAKFKRNSNKRMTNQRLLKALELSAPEVKNLNKFYSISNENDITSDVISAKNDFNYTNFTL